MSTEHDDGAPRGTAPPDDETARLFAEAEASVDAVRKGESDHDDDGIDVDAEVHAGLANDLAEALAAKAKLEQELAQAKDRVLRALADLDNQRKRAKREQDEAAVRATQSVLQSLLPTVDNIERALEIATTDGGGGGDGAASPQHQQQIVQQLVKGLQMVRNEFLSGLARQGIEPVPALGHAFDPSLHDALQQVDSPDHAPGMVVREFEKGFRMGERLLRPARVIVAGPGSTGAPPDRDPSAGSEST
jgi:molecular chaperone GrpE